MAKRQIPQSIVLDRVSFNKEFLTGFKSEKDFLKEMKKECYAHLFEGENRELKLKEVFTLVKPKKEPEI
jgi:hypothetical protein